MRHGWKGVIERQRIKNLGGHLKALRCAVVQELESYLNDPSSIFCNQWARIRHLYNFCSLATKYWTWIVEITRDWTTGPEHLCKSSVWRMWWYECPAWTFLVIRVAGRVWIEGWLSVEVSSRVLALMRWAIDTLLRGIAVLRSSHTDDEWVSNVAYYSLIRTLLTMSTNTCVGRNLVKFGP